MSNNIARLGVVMGLDTAEFTTGLGKVEKQLSSFKDKLLEFASVAAFVEMTKKAMEYAQKSKEMAEHLVEEDTDLMLAKNLQLKNYLQSQKGKNGWSKIS